MAQFTAQCHHFLCYDKNRFWYYNTRTQEQYDPTNNSTKYQQYVIYIHNYIIQCNVMSCNEFSCRICISFYMGILHTIIEVYNDLTSSRLPMIIPIQRITDLIPWHAILLCLLNLCYNTMKFPTTVFQDMWRWYTEKNSEMCRQLRTYRRLLLQQQRNDYGTDMQHWGMSCLGFGRFIICK